MIVCETFPLVIQLVRVSRKNRCYSRKASFNNAQTVLTMPKLCGMESLPTIPGRKDAPTGITRARRKNSRPRRTSVQNLMTGFDYLRAHLPSYTSGYQLTRLQTLRVAICYIRDLGQLLQDAECSAGSKILEKDESRRFAAEMLDSSRDSTMFRHPSDTSLCSSTSTSSINSAELAIAIGRNVTCPSCSTQHLSSRHGQVRNSNRPRNGTPH